MWFSYKKKKKKKKYGYHGLQVIYKKDDKRKLFNTFLYLIFVYGYFILKKHEVVQINLFYKMKNVKLYYVIYLIYNCL